VKEIFPIIPISSTSTWIIVGVVLLISTVCLFLGYIGYQGYHLSVVVGEEELTLKGPLYGRTLKLPELKGEEIRRVDLNGEDEFKGYKRTNGIGLPGLRLGWFGVPNRKKLLLFVTDFEKTVLIPTWKTYDLVVSVEEPEKLIRHLQER
jgi:hypothetical protein